MTVRKAVCGLLLFDSPAVDMCHLLPCKIFVNSAIRPHHIFISLMILTTRGTREVIKSRRKRMAWLMESLGDMREGDHLEAVGVGGRIILNWIFKKWGKGHGLDLVCLRIRTVGFRL